MMVEQLNYFSFQSVLHDWYNKGHGMCYSVSGMIHIKYSLLLIENNSLCSVGSQNSFSLYRKSDSFLLSFLPSFFPFFLPYIQVTQFNFTAYFSVVVTVSAYPMQCACILVYNCFSLFCLILLRVGFRARGGARCRSVVRAFAHGAMDRRIDASWWTH